MKLKSVFGNKKLIYILLSVFIFIFQLKFRVFPDEFLYFFCALIVILIALWFVNEHWKLMLEKIFIDYPGRINSYKNFKRNYDFACVGGTQGLYAVDFSNQTEVSGFNWCIENQTIEYDFLILKNFFSILKKDAKVLIFLSPFEIIDNNLFNCNNYKYQIFLDRFLFTVNNKKKFFFRDWLATNTLLRKKKDNLFLMSIHYYPILYPFTILKLLREVKIRKSNLKKTELLNNGKLEKDANKQAKGLLKYNSVHLFDENKTRLTEMKNFLHDRDLDLTIVIPPISSILSKKVATKEHNDKVLTYINAVLKTEIPVLNYLNDREFEDNSLYIDSYRLNTQGRNKFLTKTIQDLKIK